MTEHGRLVLVVLLVLASLLLVVRGPPRAIPLGPWEPQAPCPVAIERVGEGVTCLDQAEADRERRVAGDRVLADGGVDRMAAARLELFGAAVDLNRASLEELESLPGVGRHLAERIAAARPFASVESLRQVPEIGPHRWSRIAPRLRVGAGPDP